MSADAFAPALDDEHPVRWTPADGGPARFITLEGAVARLCRDGGDPEATRTGLLAGQMFRTMFAFYQLDEAVRWMHPRPGPREKVAREALADVMEIEAPNLRDFGLAHRAEYETSHALWAELYPAATKALEAAITADAAAWAYDEADKALMALRLRSAQ